MRGSGPLRIAMATPQLFLTTRKPNGLLPLHKHCSQITPLILN